jgi:hypothetical protein
MNYEMMTVTPELAARWLKEKNNRNRPISKNFVDAYALDMIKGRWKKTHQNAIAFYKDGNLADGQHRLHAIVQSGVSIECMVFWGLDSSDAYGIDAHRMRNTHDQIKIAGGADWINKDVIATARMMMMASRYAKKPSPQEIVEFCKDHENALRFSIQNMPKSYFSAAVRVAIAIAYYHESQKNIEDWCEVAKTGMAFHPYDRSVIAFRDRILRDPNLKSQGGANRELICKMAMRSISAFCKSESLSKIVAPKERLYEVPA